MEELSSLNKPEEELIPSSPQETLEVPEETEKEVNQEQEWAEENLATLINKVNERYERPDSTLASNPEQLKCYQEHNEEILNLSIERGTQKGLDKKQLRTLEISAILHDLTKADKPPDNLADINNYVLVTHGEAAANETRSILAENPEIMTKILGENYQKDDFETTATTIENSIRSHMGPHPGFMTTVLEGVNKKLHQKGEKEIVHPYPPEGDAIAETLLAADMRSLAGRKGIEKVLVNRSASPFFRNEDEKLCQEYAARNIKLTTEEAALISAFKSSGEARDMIKNINDRDWVNEAVKEAMNSVYFYGAGENKIELTYGQVAAKKEQLELAKSREKIKKVA
jgi:hypothetical protein